MKYRKTALVEAEQFLPADGKIPAGVIADGLSDPRKSPSQWVLDTLEGRHTLRPGDYICTGPAGERWNVEQSIFEATYEPAITSVTVPVAETAGEAVAWFRQSAQNPSAWYQVDAEERKYYEGRGQRVLPLLAHPVPAQDDDKLRRAVEALEPFAALARIRHPEEGGSPSWIDQMTNNGECDELELRSHVAFDRDRIQVLDAADFRRAETAITALNAEGK